MTPRASKHPLPAIPAAADDDLPEGWTQTKLRDLAAAIKGKKPAELLPERFEGAVPYIDIKAFETGEFREYAAPESARMAQKGDILIVWDGARSGLVGKMPDKGAVGSTLAVMQPYAGNKDYLALFLRASFQQINTNVRGTGIPHVDPEILWDLDVPLPPLAEQKRIVAKVEELLSRVNAAREFLAKVPAILKRFRQSVLAAACSGRLTAEWREENPTEDAANLIEEVRQKRPVRFRDATVRDDLDLPEIPDKWRWTNLRFLFSPNEAFCYGVVQPGTDDQDGVFLVRAGDFSNGRVALDSLRRISQRVHDQYRRSELVSPSGMVETPRLAGGD